MKVIAILLSTYNSELFLPELFDSIIDQTNKNWKLFIRDDGSTDNTLDIINHYQKKSANILILNDDIKNKGPKNSFMWMLKNTESNYYMFCDHDDVWLPEKVEKTFIKMKQLERENPDLPILVHCDLKVVDSKLNLISKSFWEYSNINPSYKSFKFYSAYSNITGCTIMINQKSKDISLNIPKNALMHDSWLALVISFNKGVIEYLEEALILYRQHAKNEIGAQYKPSFINRLYNLRKVITANKNLFTTANNLKKNPLLFLIINKIYFYIKIRAFNR